MKFGAVSLRTQIYQNTQSMGSLQEHLKHFIFIQVHSIECQPNR